MGEMDDVKADILAIKERNQRVEADKAWETSLVRLATVAVITYIVATLALWVTGNVSPFVNALIPTLGFVLSVQSLPIIKHWWIKRYLK